MVSRQSHARRRGLYRLIHSLTTEEKGYFKKFVTRHTAAGNNYSTLFDAVNKQEKFEEAELKKKFKNYSVTKVYLKEMITDSLLLYYRKNHDHINLFSQIEKIHVLLIKGLQSEAIKLLKKALAQSKKMELFTVERYLLRMEYDTSQVKFKSSEERVAYLKKFEPLFNENKQIGRAHV